MAEFYIPLGLGMTSDEQVTKAELGEESVNLYPDPDGAGYLVNYPGRTDYFVRGSIKGGVGTPPTTDTDITRIEVFRDARGQEHIVFVRGAQVCVKYGNSYRPLYTLKGTNIDGKYFPAMFVHEARLIILNFGDAPLMWDGIETVHPLGVQEIPTAPDVRVSPLPRGDYHAPTTTNSIWEYQNFWWPGKVPGNGPGANFGADGTTPVAGLYDSVVQFFDRFGNKGRVSPPSPTFKVFPNKEDASGGMLRYFAVADFMQPQLEAHIAGHIVGRTLSLNPDGGLGSRNVYYEESVRLGNNYNRITMRASDSTLASNGLMDSDAAPFAQASIGCSFRRRVFAAGFEDPRTVQWSDISLFGTTRALQQFQANDDVKALVAMDDRIAILTRSSVEILYETTAGMAVLGQDFANGTMHGRSFVGTGNGSIFGLWNKGFGFYDGTKHQWIKTPYYLQALYIDSRFYVYSAVKTAEWYLMTIRRDIVSSGNNYLLMYHFQTERWYVQEERVYDLCVYEEGFLGVDNSIYQLFRGSYPQEAVLQVRGFIPPNGSPTRQMSIHGFRLYMEPSSSSEIEVEISGESIVGDVSTGKTHSLPSKNGPGRSVGYAPYWSNRFTYDAKHNWSAPQDIWVSPSGSVAVAAVSHTFKVTFPAGHLVKVKGLGVSYSEPKALP